ncbi:o-succinylbenzoate synthase [Microlunatus parietis]|uniref:o-succinylbenzoate synthase n=1 Tax=Microlunatus parietis TaxID=682979 RepID=A0A7Y9LC74_9ACTN|nr:o-succinylbenzoate synthase [Microlunatus parietis]NYE71415.1 O-succinylbenzoate synthase [Microlunatus parietis]
MQPITYRIPMRVRFRGIDTRYGMVWRGPAGWAEWSPFLDYGGAELVPWLRAADEAADVGWPKPVRDRIEVNATVPAVGPDRAREIAAGSGCRTAKVKVAEAGQTLADDLARVEAVRDALGPGGRIRVDANGGWSVAAASRALRELDRFGLEYAEQPCRTVEELAELRRSLRGTGILIAADESIRRAEDPYRVAELGAADIAVLKVQPLGGVRAALRIAERIGLPVVVSSALETSIGIRAGVALAAALPELPYACGLNTVPLLGDDLVLESLVADRGWLPVTELAPELDRLDRLAAAPEEHQFWQARLMQTRLLDRKGSR